MREIVLPASLDIAAVRTVASEIQDALAAGPLTLDATAITKVDAAGLQLLYAALVAAHTSEAQVTWKGVPAALLEGARTLAVSHALGLQENP